MNTCNLFTNEMKIRKSHRGKKFLESRFLPTCKILAKSSDWFRRSSEKAGKFNEIEDNNKKNSRRTLPALELKLRLKRDYPPRGRVWAP